jgi:hypothetical protein
MSDNSASKSGASPRRQGGAKVLVLLGLALAVVAGVQTGYIGYGLAHLRAATFPRDERLLEYLPASDGGVLILDPHQIELKALGAEGGAARASLERTRADIKKATGIDLVVDVDKMALTPSLVVARGRFSHDRLKERLTEHAYVEAEYKGKKYLTRSGEDAIAVLDGSILLYGAEAAIQAGIDAEAGDTSLADREDVTDRLKAGGWDHPILGTVQLADTKPSLRAILTGFTGPRSITVAVSMKGGLSIRAAIEAASPSGAEELRKLLEEKQKDAEALKGLAGPDIGPVLADITRRAKITAKADSNQLSIDVDLTPEELEKLIKATEKGTAGVGELYKNVRLFQLLTPGP